MKNTKSFYLGPARVEPLRNLICVNNEEIRIERQTMQVLLCLAGQPGQVCTRNDLLSTAWPDTFPCDGVLAKAICTLRKALGDQVLKPTFIETIPKIGYRLMVEVLPVYQPKTERSSPSTDRPSLPESEKIQQSTRTGLKPRIHLVRLQSAVLALFILMTGVLAFLLLRQPIYQTENVRILTTSEMTENGRVDSTVVIRTNISEEDRLLPLFDRNVIQTDTTIDVIKHKIAP